MNVNIYNINFKKLVVWLVPSVLRRPTLLALLYALVAPIIYVYNLFLINRRSNLYRLLITPQVCYVEMALNNKYDSVDRRIEIVKPKNYEPLFLYRKIENKPVYLYKKTEVAKPKTWLYQKGETLTFQYDFIVKVPIQIIFNEKEMRAIIDGYILPDKIYKISTV